jgi:hypothetical protein
LLKHVKNSTLSDYSTLSAKSDTFIDQASIEQVARKKKGEKRIEQFVQRSMQVRFTPWLRVEVIFAFAPPSE